MSTKILLYVEDGLSPQEMDDLRFLLSDAIHEFATRRAAPADYVDRHLVLDDRARREKIAQVARRAQLARKLHPSTMLLDYEHTLPHAPTPVYDYYRTCEEADLPAMTAALHLLPASLFGDRSGWTVQRDRGDLVLEGPDARRATWDPRFACWAWQCEDSDRGPDSANAVTEVSP